MYHELQPSQTSLLSAVSDRLYCIFHHNFPLTYSTQFMHTLLLEVCLAFCVFKFFWRLLSISEGDSICCDFDWSYGWIILCAHVKVCFSVADVFFYNRWRQQVDKWTLTRSATGNTGYTVWVKTAAVYQQSARSSASRRRVLMLIVIDVCCQSTKGLHGNGDGGNTAITVGKLR